SRSAAPSTALYAPPLHDALPISQDYHDTYTERVEKLVKDKKAGRKSEPAPEPAEPTEVSSLMDVLQRSVEQAKGKSGKKSGGKQQPADLDDMSKSDLLELAKELDIKRRSKMSVDDLRKAVRRAEKKAQRAA